MKTYHLVHVSILWVLIATGILFLAFFAAPSNAAAYVDCNSPMNSLDCLISGEGQRQREERYNRDENLRIQKEMLREQQRQTQIMRNNQFNNQFNTYGVQ